MRSWPPSCALPPGGALHSWSRRRRLPSLGTWQPALHHEAPAASPSPGVPTAGDEASSSLLSPRDRGSPIWTSSLFLSGPSSGPPAHGACRARWLHKVPSLFPNLCHLLVPLVTASAPRPMPSPETCGHGSWRPRWGVLSPPLPTRLPQTSGAGPPAACDVQPGPRRLLSLNSPPGLPTALPAGGL